MRKFLSMLVIAAMSALPLTAIGGECSGFTCQNGCPLAKTANERRATGSESVRASTVVREEVSATVARNLEKI